METTKQYFYVGKDIYDANGNWISPSEWQTNWVGQSKQEISRPSGITLTGKPVSSVTPSPSAMQQKVEEGVSSIQAQQTGSNAFQPTVNIKELQPAIDVSTIYTAPITSTEQKETFTEGGLYKSPDSSTVYQYMAGEFRPIKNEEDYRKVIGAKEGEKTDWSLVKTIPQIGKVGPTIEPKQEVKKTSLTEKQLTPEWMEKTYKLYLGEDYTPGINEDGTPQTWESIARHHAISGTSYEDLIDWLKSPTTQAQAKKEIEAKKPYVSDQYLGENGKIYWKDENGNFHWITDPQELKNLKDIGFVSDVQKQMSLSEIEGVKTITDIQNKTASQIKISDLTNAGFSADDAAKIIASFGEMPKWSNEIEKIESEFSEERQKIENDIKIAEDALIAEFEKNPALVDTFNSFYASSELPNIKTKIDNIDTQIDTITAKRDKEILDVRGEPIPQWMITGDKALILQRYTDEINRLISQRNVLADDYNRSWNEIITKVGLQEKDLAKKAEHLSALVDIYSGREEKIKEKLTEALEKGKIKNTEEQEEILNQIKGKLAPTLASFALETAKAKALGDITIKEDGLGGLWLFDPNTGIWQQILEGKPIGGESVGYWQKNKETGEWEQIIPGVGVTEKELTPMQIKINDAWKKIKQMEEEGYTPEEIRDAIMNNGLNPEDFGYSNEQVSESYMQELKNKAIYWEQKVVEDPDLVKRIYDSDTKIIQFKAKKDFTDKYGEFKKGEIVFQYITG